MRWKNSLAAAKDSGVTIFSLEESDVGSSSPIGESSSLEESPLVYILYILSAGQVPGKVPGKMPDFVRPPAAVDVKHSEFQSGEQNDDVA